jgi:hypothetical protein
MGRARSNLTTLRTVTGRIASVASDPIIREQTTASPPMAYRQALLDNNGHLGQSFQLLTESQLSKLAQWSIIKERDVLSLLRQAAFMAEDDGSGRTVTLTGTLPLSGLYGAMLADGSTHT